MSWLRKCGTVSWMLEETRQCVYTRENNRLIIIYIVLLTIYSNILVMILLRFLRPSGRLGVFVGNSYLCIGGYTQNATPTGRLGSCNLRGFYRCLGLQKKDTYVILATSQTTYPLHPQLLLYPHHQPHNKTQHSRWCPKVFEEK